MYMHNNHCHRSTAHLQFIIIIIIITTIIKSYNNLSVWFLSLKEGLKTHEVYILYLYFLKLWKLKETLGKNHNSY